MVNEESEVRRMTEIADAINSILKADTAESENEDHSNPPFDAPVTASTRPQDEAALDINNSDRHEEVEPDAMSETGDAIKTGMDTQSPSLTPSLIPSLAMADMKDQLSAEELDVAIAAEFASDSNNDNLFGPPADLNLSTTPVKSPVGDPMQAPAESVTKTPMDDPVENPVENNAIGQVVRADSDLSHLSLRMQDTLAEIKSQASASYNGAGELLAEMDAARTSLMDEVRGEIGKLADETRKRRQRIMAELEQLEQQNLLTRDEMEMLLVKFEHNLGTLYQRYFENAENERARLQRYRDFLQFLLDERGL